MRTALPKSCFGPTAMHRLSGENSWARLQEQSDGMFAAFNAEKEKAKENLPRIHVSVAKGRRQQAKEKAVTCCDSLAG